jgi:hypothetical protein
MLDEIVYRPLELGNSVPAFSADALCRDFTEPPFHEVQPRRVCRDEVFNESARSRIEIVPHFLSFMGSVIVCDNVKCLVLRALPIDPFQEGYVIICRMLFTALADDFSTENIQGSKQRGRAMAVIVVRLAFRHARQHGQDRLGTLQCLYLGLFVHA